MNRRWLVTGSAAALTVGALVVGVVVASSSDHSPSSAPPVLRVASSPGLTSEAADLKQPAIAPLRPMEFQTPKPLPALDGSAAVYQITRTAAAAHAAALARYLGVTTTVDASHIPVNADQPYLFVSGRNWFYSQSAVQTAVASCATVTPPDKSTPPPSLCSEPPATPNLPDDAAATAKARALALAAGMGALDFEVSRNPYSVQVQATVHVDGVLLPMAMSVSFGEAGKIMFAEGLFLGDRQRVADYPRIGTAAALVLLQNGSSPWYGGVRPMTAAGSAAGSAGSAGSVAATESSSLAPVLPAPQPPEPNKPGNPTTPPPTITPPKPPPSDLPEPPPSDIPEPPKVVVILDKVESVYLTLQGADGPLLLVPGYRFSGTNHETFDVIALDKSFIQAVEPPRPVPAAGSSSGGAPATAAP